MKGEETKEGSVSGGAPGSARSQREIWSIQYTLGVVYLEELSSVLPHLSLVMKGGVGGGTWNSQAPLALVPAQDDFPNGTGTSIHSHGNWSYTGRAGQKDLRGPGWYNDRVDDTHQLPS